MNHSAIALTLVLLALGGTFPLLTQRSAEPLPPAPLDRAPLVAPESRTLVKILPDFPPLSIEALVGFSSDVVIGRITEVRAVAPRQGYPYIEYRLAIDESLVGAASGSLVLRHFGGACEEYDVKLQGAPRLAQDESVLLFLAKDPDSETRGIVGLEQGTYHLREFGPNDAGYAEGPLVPAGTETSRLVGDVLSAAKAIGKR